MPSVTGGSKPPWREPRGSRTLHVYSGNLYGGIETFLRTLARHPRPALAATDFALCFEGRLAKELREAGATLHVLGAVRTRSLRSIIAARRALAETLRRHPYEVVVCHSAWPHALFAPVVRAYGPRLAYHMHDAPNALGWPDRWASLTAPDLVLCNSEFTASRGPWFFPRVPRVVARCPVEFDRSAARGRPSENACGPRSVCRGRRDPAGESHASVEGTSSPHRCARRAQSESAMGLLDRGGRPAPRRGRLRARDAKAGPEPRPWGSSPVPWSAKRCACAHGGRRRLLPAKPGS